MDDKAYKLLEKLYSEFSLFRKETKEDIAGLKGDLLCIKNDIIRIENDHGAKLDFLMVLNEGQQEIKKDIKDLKETKKSYDLKLRKVK